MELFTLRILTPDKCFFEAEAEEVVFDTPEGRMGVRAGHMLMIAAVTECVLNLIIDGEAKTAAVSQGFAEIQGDLVEMFVDTAEWSDKIDAVRAKQAYERAQLMLQSATNRAEYIRSQAAMARALARLRAAAFK